METLDVTIEKLVYGGEGLAHANGRTVFVPFVLPGEVARVEPVEQKKKFIRAHLREVLSPSPARGTAVCPHFGACGGCHYQHISYDAQVQYKSEILRETLRRIGRVDWAGAIETHPSPPLGYRNRAQWKIQAGAAAGIPAQIGYFQAGSSALVGVTQCPILAPQLAGILDVLRELLSNNAMPPGVDEIEAFADAEQDRVLLNISVTAAEETPAAIAQGLRRALPCIETILLHDTAHDRFELDGPGFIHYAAAGHRLRVGHLSFFQVNRFLIDDLAQAVAGDHDGKLTYDLFAGVGLFTLPLARRFDRVVGVDSNVAAVRDLKSNIEVSGAKAEAVNLDADVFLQRAKSVPDLVVLDPPRAGVTPKALAKLLQLLPSQITYLSCDPATLARDLGVLAGAPAGHAGYRICEVHLFDIFPQTYHIETLVRLERCG